MFDPAKASGEELCQRRLTLEHEQRVRDAEAARIEAELDRRALCDREFGLSTGSWLAAEKDLPVGSCRFRVRVANWLTSQFELTLEALEAGLISWDHVRVIHRAANPRIVDKVAAVQQLLIDEARGQAFHRWRSMVEHLADRLDVDGGYDPARDRTGTVYCSPTIDGLVHLFATLTAEQSLSVLTELERVTDELWRQAVRDHDQCPEIPIPDRAELRAQALVEVHRRAAARDIEATVPPRPEFVVVLRPQHDPTTGGAAQTPDGVPVRPELLTDLCSDATWRALWVDRRGLPLRLGRSTASPRLASASLWRCVMVAACSPAATGPCHGATPTTSRSGIVTTATPTCPSWPCCAGTTTASPTAAGGP